MAAFMAELFRLNLYKRSQGRFARQVTFAVLAVIVALGAWRLNVWLEGRADADRQLGYVVPLGVLVLGWWIIFRLVQLPKFADFLISVEGEMNKVTWPKQGELIRASLVVMAVIFLLAALLYFYDLIWKGVFGWLLQ
ncbi:MAG: preprotein translocase subunit SecE [Pirellulales bacterium]|nr:preprotein translocase subunit SecE [Pirellulales bacterium]